MSHATPTPRRSAPRSRGQGRALALAALLATLLACLWVAAGARASSLEGRAAPFAASSGTGVRSAVAPDHERVDLPSRSPGPAQARRLRTAASPDARPAMPGPGPALLAPALAANAIALLRFDVEARRTSDLVGRTLDSPGFRQAKSPRGPPAARSFLA